MKLCHSGTQHFLRKVVRVCRRLAELHVRVGRTRDCLDKVSTAISAGRNETKGDANLVYSLECFPKRPLPKARTRELRAPQKIRVAKDKFDRRSAHYGATGSDDPSRLYDIHHDLDIERPVAWVVENKDGGYWRLREVN